MANERAGLTRDVKAGEAVILSTGANATLRRGYPKGYDGEVEIEFDGNRETERVDGITLPDAQPWTEPSAPGDADAALGDADAAQEVTMGETRAPSRRMED